MARLQETIKDEFGKRYISAVQLPDYFETGLNPSKHLRPYQVECFQYFLTYMNPENEFAGKAKRPHLLFHMATGSGKTLQMAGAMLYLYEQGYRNFLFFVGSTNIVEKTRDNFFNVGSAKYMFAPSIYIDGKIVKIKEVENFQGASKDCLNLCLSTIQGLHIDLNTKKENSITYEDFSNQPIVLIADEAHHLNAGTRNDTLEEDDNWESTVNKIFNTDNGVLPNVLLEFTATMDLTNPAILHKYDDKVIFDYALKNFRADKYSKEVETIEADLNEIDRALQAIILSQYKKKLFAELRLNVKPVVLLKSKTINDNKTIFERFKNVIATLTPSYIDRIRLRANGDLKQAFDYFKAQALSDQNIIFELQGDFAEERLLLVDGKNITSEKQRLLNSLEDENNEIRAIFAVDMLNEGWDVLNLYDIVRLYNTRDAKDNKPGNTTMQEAQLIGRGARYMPFIDPNNLSLDIDRRKYDDDVENKYRLIETLHYHSAHNPRYIQELRIALIQTGIIPDNHQQLELFLKDDFKESSLYENGIVFVNEQKRYADVADDGTIGANISKRMFKVKMPTGKMRSGLLFGDNAPSEVLTSLTIPSFDFINVGKHVIRAAMNFSPTFHFDSLHRLYPQLGSCKEFIESASYLAKLHISVIGKYETLNEYSQEDKLYIAKEVLKQIEPMLQSRGKSYRGSKRFSPKEFKNIFRDKIVLNVALSETSDKEFGFPQKTPRNSDYAIDLVQQDWYAYNENYGTSEEKALVKYVESVMPKLKEKYEKVYLVRNEKDLRIFSFDEGRPFEPDFILFLRVKGVKGKYDNLQIFIEPKGNQLLLQDKWKEDFLKQISALGEVRRVTSTDKYNVWGLPFFNENNQNTFIEAFDEDVIKYECSESVIDAGFQYLIVDDVLESKKFTTHLPVFQLRAACGYLDNAGKLQSDDAEGWVDVSERLHNLNKGMFIVHAEGASMEPKIHDGDLCVFDLTGGGSREGKTVLVKAKDKSDPSASSYAIKVYSSKKSLDEDGGWHHSQIVLSPLNSAFSPIVINEDEVEDGEFKVFGELVEVL